MCLSCPVRLQIRNIDFSHRRSVAVKSRWETLLWGIFFCVSVHGLLLLSHPQCFLHALQATSWTDFYFIFYFLVVAGLLFCVFSRRVAVNTDDGGSRLVRIRRSTWGGSRITQQQLDRVQNIHLANLRWAAFPVSLGTSLSAGFHKKKRLHSI